MFTGMYKGGKSTFYCNFLLAAVRGEPFEGRPSLVLSHALYTCQRAVRTRRWLFVRTYHPGLFCFPPLALYDMDSDPYETTDVSAQHPQAVRECDHLLAEWQAEMLGRPGAEPDPMSLVIETGPWKYVTLDRWLAGLRDLGREDAAGRIRASLGMK